MHRRTLLFVLAFGLSFYGCDKDDAVEKKEQSAKTSVKPGSGSGRGWADLLGLKKKRPAGQQVAGRSLKEVVKAFKSFRSCLDSLQGSLPPDLGLDILTYYNIPDALCRTREAMARGDVTACKRAVSYSMRKGCQVMYAIYAAKPADCPLGYPRRRGRDGYCLAMAARDASLCRASKKQQEEARCKAILNDNPDACDSLTRPADRDSCHRESKRWSGFTKAGSSALANGYIPGLELTITMENGSTPPVSSVNATCAGFGAVSPSTGFDKKVNFCEYYKYGYRYGRTNYRSAASKTQVNFAFRPPQSDTGKIAFGADADFGVKIRGFGEFKANPVGQITFKKFERRRGGRIAGTFKVTVNRGMERMKVEGKFDTFVRDVVEPSQMRAPYTSRSGYGRGVLGGLRGTKPGKWGRIGGLSGRLGGRLGGRVGGVGGRVGGLGGGAGRYGGAQPATRRYAAVLSSATVRAEKARGRTIGYKVTLMRPGSIWNRLRVQNDDVVTDLGKLKLRTIGDVVKIRMELRDATKRLIIRLRRRGAAKTIVLSKRDIEAIQRDYYF